MKASKHHFGFIVYDNNDPEWKHEEHNSFYHRRGAEDAARQFITDRIKLDTDDDADYFYQITKDGQITEGYYGP